MLARVVRWLAESLIRLYYPERSLTNAEQLPRNGPVIFVLNHPNGLLDPIVLRVAVGRPVRFLAKGTLFGNPLGRLAMRAFGSIPVFRARDAKGGGPGGGQDRGAANEATFARCRALLAAGEALALFPEGTSHSDPTLKPLKPGAARIALGAEREHLERTGRALGVPIVPVGLAYDDKALFRSSVRLVIGKPIVVSDRGAEFARDERAAVDRLTDDIRAALDEVVLQAETRELLEGVARVAAWTAPLAEGAPDPGQQHRRARALLDAYRALSARSPEAVERVVRTARDYARVLRALGVRDPWALELEPVSPLRSLGAVGRLALAAPLALVGALLAWIPYRLAGQVAKRVTREQDVLGTVKLLTGALFLAVFWGAEAAIAGAVLGARWGVVTAIVAPITGYAALRFDEMLSVMKESLHHSWLRAARADEVRRLADRRRALAEEIARALGQAA